MISTHFKRNCKNKDYWSTFYKKYYFSISTSKSHVIQSVACHFFVIVCEIDFVIIYNIWVKIFSPPIFFKYIFIAK